MGIDLSQGMLDHAAAKGFYRELRRPTMGEPLDYETDAVDAIICARKLVPGHASASSLYELVSVTASGGHIIFGLSDYYYEIGGFGPIIDELTASGAFEFVGITEPYLPMPQGELEFDSRVFTCKVGG